MNQGANKLCELIVEFGSAYTKMGFSIDSQPRKVVKTSLHKYRGKSRISEEIYIEELLHQLFDIEMVCGLKGKSVVMIYNYYGIEDLHNIIGLVLFQKFEVSRIAFVVGNVLPLYVSGHFSGIVIDAGYQQTTACAVYEGMSLLHLGGRIGEGDKDVQLKLAEKQYKADEQCRILNIGEPLNSANGCYTMTYFGDYAAEESNIAYGFLQMLQRINSMDLLHKICQNIIIIGGGAQLNNFIKRFSDEVQLLCEYAISYIREQQFKVLRRLKMYLNPVHRYAIWIGGCLITQIDGHDKFIVSATKFKENGNMFITRSDMCNFIQPK